MRRPISPIHIGEIEGSTAIVFYLFVVLGLGGFLGWSAWYVFGDGMERDHERVVRSILDEEPVAAADRAFAAGELRFYAIKCPGRDSEIPGRFPAELRGRDQLREQGYSVRVIEADHGGSARDRVEYQLLLDHFTAFNTRLAEQVWVGSGSSSRFE